MRDDHGVVREIAWRDILPWLILVRVFRVSIQARMLLLASMAVLLTIFGWWLFAQGFANFRDDDPLAAYLDDYASCPWTSPSSPADVSTSVLNPFNVLSGSSPAWDSGPPELGRYPRDAFFSPWRQLSAPVRQLFDLKLS